MKRRIARHKRTLALLLTLCLLFTCLPLQAMSAGGTAEETDISNEVYIVDEDITKRGEYEKHFLCSDGTYRAVTYAEPVHYYDSSTGTWQDNDVALTLNAASTRYEAQSGALPSRLPSPTLHRTCLLRQTVQRSLKPPKLHRP